MCLIINIINLYNQLHDTVYNSSDFRTWMNINLKKNPTGAKLQKKKKKQQP